MNKFHNGFFTTPNNIFEINCLSSIEKLVYIYICRCDHNSTAFPSYKKIAQNCSVCRKTAINAVQKLGDLNLIEKKPRKKEESFNMTNVYIVKDPGDKSEIQKTFGGEFNTPANEFNISSNESVTSPSEDIPPNKRTNELITRDINTSEKTRDMDIPKGISYDDKYSFKEYQQLQNTDKESLKAMEHFVKNYHKYMGKEHFKLFYSQWIQVQEAVLSPLSDMEVGQEFEIALEDELLMIDKYFLSSLDCNYSIMHYISGDIRLLRYYEQNH